MCILKRTTSSKMGESYVMQLPEAWQLERCRVPRMATLYIIILPKPVSSHILAFADVVNAHKMLSPQFSINDDQPTSSKEACIL